MDLPDLPSSSRADGFCRPHVVEITGYSQPKRVVPDPGILFAATATVPLPSVCQGGGASLQKLLICNKQPVNTEAGDLAGADHPKVSPAPLDTAAAWGGRRGVTGAPSGSAGVVSKRDGRRHIVVLCASKARFTGLTWTALLQEKPYQTRPVVPILRRTAPDHKPSAASDSGDLGLNRHLDPRHRRRGNPRHSGDLSHALAGSQFAFHFLHLRFGKRRPAKSDRQSASRSLPP